MTLLDFLQPPNDMIDSTPARKQFHEIMGGNDEIQVAKKRARSSTGDGPNTAKRVKVEFNIDSFKPNSKSTVKDLKAFCSHHGLLVSGKKADLLERALGVFK